MCGRRVKIFRLFGDDENVDADCRMIGLTRSLLLVLPASGGGVLGGLGGVGRPPVAVDRR